MLDLKALAYILNKLASLEEFVKKDCDKIILNERENLVKKNREQLWDGRDANDMLITPSYSQDPYFKTPIAAKKYAAWKKRITPSSKRPEDTPNLFINGKFHSEIDMKKVNENVFEFFGDGIMSNKIVPKYSDKILGIGKEATNQLDAMIEEKLTADITKLLTV